MAAGPAMAVHSARPAHTLSRNDAPQVALADHGIPNAPMPVRHSVVRRILLGIVLLFVLAGGGAWLLHASIDPNEAVFGPNDAQEQRVRAAS